MWPVCKKEFRQFFSSLTGIIAIAVFLLLNGLFLFVFPDTNILDFGYATLDKFFDLAPWILTFLVPAITMRSFAEEFKTGTYEILQTKPLGYAPVVGGKYLGSLLIVVLALLPTLLYVFSMQSLSTGAIDTRVPIGFYIGLVFSAAVFALIPTLCSRLIKNPVTAFIVHIFACFVLFFLLYVFSKSSISESNGNINLEGTFDFYFELFFLAVIFAVIDTPFRRLPSSSIVTFLERTLACLALLLLIYKFSLLFLNTNSAGIDMGGTIGAYIGLFFLAAVFTAIGICCSSFTSNAVVAFIVSAFACFILYTGFNAVSRIASLAAGPGYYIEMLGIDFHYRSISRGVIDSRDIIYFISVIAFFLLFTQRNLIKRKP